MYYIQKSFEISASHKLVLNYESKCRQLHGHNWHVVVCCRSKELDENGMVVDFTIIKQRIQDVLDHAYINDVFPFNPTSENLARWITEQIPNCYRTTVQESDGNLAIYEVDE